jgi:hypothetical protein
MGRRRAFGVIEFFCGWDAETHERIGLHAETVSGWARGNVGELIK